MKTQMIRLLVVDDHPIIRAGFRTIEEMTSDIRIVGEAKDSRSAFEAIANIRPDVVLLDIRLQEENGLEVCRRAKLLAPPPRVLVLSSCGDEQSIMSALEAGADGYLLKENDTHQLIGAIRAVAAGESVFDAPRSHPERRLASGREGLKPGSADLMSRLSHQERRLLAEVARGKTDKEAAAVLGLTPKTARNYLDRIFGKLNIHNRTEAALLYVRWGKGEGMP